MSVSQLLPLIEQLAQSCERQAYAWMTSFSPTAESLVDDITDMTNVWCDSAALLAADWYNDQDADGQYRARGTWDLDRDQRTAIANWIMAGPQAPENQARAMGRSLVYTAARKTIWANAELEGVAVVRYEEANACGNCQVRATSRITPKNASSDQVFRDFHHSCSGIYIPVRAGIYEPPDYARSWGEKIAAARLAGKVNTDDIAKWLEGN